MNHKQLLLFLSALLLAISVNAQKEVNISDITGKWHLTRLANTGVTMMDEHNISPCLEQSVSKVIQYKGSVTGQDSTMIISQCKALMTDMKDVTMEFKSNGTFYVSKFQGGGDFIKGEVDTGSYIIIPATNTIYMKLKGLETKSDISLNNNILSIATDMEGVVQQMYWKKD